MIHNLKTHPRFFDHVSAGLKTFEVRKDDRGFVEGDILVLHRWPGDEWHNCLCSLDDCNHKTERLTVQVTYIVHGGQYGIGAGYVVMGIDLEAKP